jgi:guanine deaminase
MTREEKFMMAAIKAGNEGMRNNIGGPFGCVIVKGDEIVGTGCNRVISSNDPTAHAEVVAIRDACKNLGSFQLDDCEVFTSCEPCPMCMGALYWARPSRIYFANTKTDAASIGFDDSFIYEEIALPIHNRKLQMVSVKLAEAKQMFDEWASKMDKTEY